MLVWFDGARDLDGHVGAPWEHMIELSPPTSQNTSWLSPEPDSWGSRRDATGRNHRAPLARLDYEKQLDYTVAIQDPFYALTGILNFVVRSEHHFLKTIEPTLEYSLADLNNNGQLLALKDISYNKSILERHVRQIKECISCVKSRGGPDWPRPQESISKEATVAAQRLLADLEILLECAENLVSSCHQQMSHIFNSTALQQSGTSIEQTRYIGVLTRITILFLPLSFVSSFWGMSASELGSGSKPLWLWLVTSAPVLVISIVFVYVLSGGLDLAQMLKFRSKGKRSGDLGVKGQELVGESQSGPSLEDMLILNKAQSRAARDRAELAAGPRSRNSFTSAIDLEKNSS